MANAKPLSLRQQRADKNPGKLSGVKAVEQAEVLVDSGVYHLSEPYSYLVPETLVGITLGSVVSVPFNSVQTIGVVIHLGPITRAGLKSIHGIASKYVIPKSVRDLVSGITRNYVCAPFDAYKFCLPPLSKSSSVISRNEGFEAPEVGSKVSVVISQISESVDELLIGRVMRNSSTRRLCILPTARDVERIASKLRSENIDFVEYGSHLSQSERRKAYEEITLGEAATVLGTRSAIFAPMTSVGEIIVINESSEHMYEPKTPYWSIREIATLRSSVEGSELFFLSASPSTQLMYEIYRGSASRIARKPFAGFMNRARISCAPANYVETVRRGLSKGSVLVSVAEKGFSNLFLCKRCRNVARCKCGGRIVIAERNLFLCNLCSDVSERWICKECSSSDYLMLRTGTERLAEELGRSFTGTSLFVCTAEKPMGFITEERCIVVATSGMEPEIHGGYSSIVLLNGEELVSRPFVRADEEVLQRWFSTLQHLRKGGEIFISLPNAHRISQSIVAGDPTKFLERELEEREMLDLPPIRDLILIESKGESLASLRGKLLKQFPSSRAHLATNSRRILLMVQKNERAEVLASLRALQKLRSINKKDLLKICLNPYRF